MESFPVTQLPRPFILQFGPGPYLKLHLCSATRSSQCTPLLSHLTKLRFLKRVMPLCLHAHYSSCHTDLPVPSTLLLFVLQNSTHLKYACSLWPNNSTSKSFFWWNKYLHASMFMATICNSKNTVFEATGISNSRGMAIQDYIVFI